MGTYERMGSQGRGFLCWGLIIWCIKDPEGSKNEDNKLKVRAIKCMVCADNLFYADLHGIYSDICSLYYVKRGSIIFTMAR